MAFIRGEPVKTQTPGVDPVLHLLGNHRLVGRKVEVVTAPPELMQIVVLSSKFAIDTCLDVSTHAKSLGFEPGKLCISVPVAVVAILVPDLPEYGHTHFVVVADK